MKIKVNEVFGFIFFFICSGILFNNIEKHIYFYFILTKCALILQVPTLTIWGA